MTKPVPERNQKAFSVAVARARNAADLTVDQLAEKSGLARRTVLNIEKGKSDPKASSLHALAHAFDMSYDDLMRHLCEGHTLPGTPES